MGNCSHSRHLESSRNTLRRCVTTSNEVGWAEVSLGSFTDGLGVNSTQRCHHASSLMGKSNTLQYKPERQDGGSLTRGGLDAHDNHVPLAGTGDGIMSQIGMNLYLDRNTFLPVRAETR